MTKKGYVYILTNYNKTVLYTGVTSNLAKRVYEHKSKLIKGFSKTYHTDQLVYYECFDDIRDAIAKEKQIKGGSRKKKETLINKFNPEWLDLYESILS